MTRFSPAEIDDIKARNSCDGYAMGMVKLRKVRGKDRYAGPCPFCSKNLASKSDGRFECWPDGWVCAACADGGDIIALVAKDKGFDAKADFLKILDILGGIQKQEETPATAKRAGRAAFIAGKTMDARPDDWSDDLKRAFYDGWKAGAAAQDINARYRERERARLYENYWMKAVPWPGTQVETYLREVRGVAVPENAHIKFLDDCPLFCDGSEVEPVVAHSGPAMLCAIWGPDPLASADRLARGQGYRFAGLHFTWLDLSKPKGKAIVNHPNTGEALPAKKSRGTKQGGYLDLGGCKPESAVLMISGEGVENCLTGYRFRRDSGRPLDGVNVRCGIDLGNLSGKALDRLTHPTLKTAAGRARIVPGPAPDMSSPAMPLPIGVRRAVWMCDGDSDPFITANAMKRVETRHGRDDLKQVFMWPGAGRDWNELVPKVTFK